MSLLDGGNCSPYTEHVGKAKRTRSGCLNCRRKKRKCDETKPACDRCCRVGAKCEYGTRISFRSPITSTVTSPEAVSRKHHQKNFRICNMTDSITRQGENRVRSSPTGDRDSAVPHSDNAVQTQLNQFVFYEPTNTTSQSTSEKIYAQTPGETLSAATRLHLEYDTPVSQQAELAAENLLSLRQTDQSASTSSIAQSIDSEIIPVSDPAIGPSLESFDFEDGIFFPGSTYLDLHSTLRTHLFQESRSVPATRWGSPEESELDVTTIESNPVIDPLEAPVLPEHSGLSDEASQQPSLTDAEECFLWKNYLDEVSPWLDKFDRQEHFRLTLPIMAKSTMHLRFSILAVSARQMEKKRESNRSGTNTPSSLALYQYAIHLLLPQLRTRSVEVIASCVVLCVLEMLSCSPRAWQRHLDGCAILLKAVGINGFSGGLAQALFWCFARMDVCGGLISSTRTLIPVSHWTPQRDLRSAILLFRSSTTFENHANQAVFLLAHVVDLLAEATVNPHASVFGQVSLHENDFTGKWKQLWECLESWHSTRPEEMTATFCISSTSSFPTILYSNPAGISGNQMYHTAALLLLQHKPSQVTLPRHTRSVLWHARRIVGISLSNTHHGCWTNSLQPLWIAGRCFSSLEEHKTILRLLERIEREIGWATEWRANDLKEWWGDLG